MARTLTTTVTITTSGNLTVEEIATLFDDLLAIGFADAAACDGDNERAAAACELEVERTPLVEC